MPAINIPTIPAKTIVTRVQGSYNWFSVDYNMNIYRGCPHGCIYCDSRSDCYRNFDFGTVKAKADALRIIRNELRRKVRTGVIATGAMSDPYNPHEQELRLSRNALELINAFGFGVSIATKSPLAARDADILQDIKAHSPAMVMFSVTTADDKLCKLLEPDVACSSERFDALEQLACAGIFCGVLMMPILPFINDTPENITGILHRAKDAGAAFVYPSFGVSLRSGNREYFYHHLDSHFPGLRQMYASRYGNMYQCHSPHNRKLWATFMSTCEQLGLLHRMDDINKRLRTGYADRQLRFM
ncbi:MAG: radical SAM protein [Defluviitaleaceae bacterium]|nr:radical SAM protein [Defluviitaleaceae bacterium]